MKVGRYTAGWGFNNEAFEQISAYISKKERENISDDDFAWPEEKKYPIRSQEELDAAAKLIGRAPKSKQAAIKARAIKIAKRKGLKLPDSWAS
jgi:hypothetical protein